MRCHLAVGTATVLTFPFILAGCHDADAPTAPVDGLDLPAPPAVALVRCAADVRARTLACAPSIAHGQPGPQRAVIVGGQGTYVQLASDNVSYDGSSVFQADVTVENLIAQPMGTPDGSTVTGLKVFFHSGPTVTSGSGTVSVANADGTDTFTAADQPYFAYNTILQQSEVSAAKTWQWNVPPSAATFEFSVYVSTDIPVVPGDWDVTPTPYFGTAEFTVNAQSSAITFIWFHFDNYTCGSFTQPGSAGFGSTWPITDRNFSIDHTAHTGDRFVFTGTFGTLGDEAWGTWQVTLAGNTCSGTWVAVPKPNLAPTATITSPSDWSSYSEGATITFTGSGSDPEDGALNGGSLVWETNLGGQIGTGTSFTRNDLTHVAVDWEDATSWNQYGISPDLSAIRYSKDFNVTVAGHLITLEATDGNGASGVATVHVEIAGGSATFDVTAVIAGTPNNPMYIQKTSSFTASEGDVRTATELINVTGYRSAEFNEICTYIYLFSDVAYVPGVMGFPAYPYEWPPGVFTYYCPESYAFANP